MIDKKILNLTEGLVYIVAKSWYSLIEDIESETYFIVDDKYINNPQKYILLYDSDGNEYEAEVTKYYEGDYELRFDNVHPIGLNKKQRDIVKSSSYVRTSSNLSVFTSWNEAYDIILKVVDKYFDLDQRKINSKIELLNEVFENDKNWDEAYIRWLDSKNETNYEDTYETMLEDSSRYLEN